MKRRTFEDEAEEREHIEREAVRLIPLLAAGQRGMPKRRAEQQVKTLATLITRRERRDRCYYCGSKKRELSTDETTRLTTCSSCAGDLYGYHLQQTRRLQERINEGYLP